MGEDLRFEVSEAEAAYRDIARVMLSGASDREIRRYARVRAILAMIGAGMVAVFIAQIVALALGVGRVHWVFAAFVAVVAASGWRRIAVWMLSETALARAEASPLFGGAQTWTFSDTGLWIRTTVSQSSFEWAAFDRVLQSERALGLASGPVYFALPMESGPERDALVARINGWIGA